MGFSRIVAVAVALALLVAGLTFYLVFTDVGTLAGDRAWVGHTHDVIEATQRLRTSIEAAEDGERGYLLTKDRRYLAPYLSAVADLPHDEARLRALVADNPRQVVQVERLDRAIGLRLATLADAVARADAADFSGARAPVAAGRGRSQMDAVRAREAQVVETENRLLVTRTARAHRAQNLTLLIGLSVSLLALAALTWGIVLLANANRRLNAALVEARRAEAERATLGALTEALFANVPDYLFVLDVEDDRFVIADINPAFERAMQVSAESVRGRSIDQLLAAEPAERLVGHYRRVIAAGQPVTTRDEIPFPDGPRVWESILAPVRDSEGEVGRLIGSVRDITDRVRGEERLRDSQRLEAVGQLTGGVAHDFNNLLQVIRGNLELLVGAVEGDARAAGRLRNALYGAERAAQLTRQLLAFARRQPLAPKVINLSRLVLDVADLLRRTLGETIEIETVVAGGLWNTTADPAQVESALLNLALNARDAMPHGGRLTVEVTNSALDEAYARAAGEVAPGQYVMLAVTDTGEGMPESVRLRAFEPFFTTKADGRGTGLGLSMVYGFVKQSNGHIQIYSEEGHGTTVKIYLPRSRQRVEAPSAAVEVSHVADGSLTVLVVEDEPAVREAAIALIGDLGYRTLEAADAESALALVIAGEAIDLVFTDVVMPGTLRTREFAQRLRDLRPDLPVLFTSGYTDNAIIHQGRLDEGVHLISKPYARGDLAKRIEQLLGRATEA